jgi:hypothetical protein
MEITPKAIQNLLDELEASKQSRLPAWKVSVPKASDDGTQVLNRLVPNPEGFRQSMFQDFSLNIESLLGRWRNCNVSQLC